MAKKKEETPAAPAAKTAAKAAPVAKAATPVAPAAPSAAAPVPTPQPVTPAHKPSGFDIHLGFGFDRKFDQVMLKAMRDAGRSAGKQIGDLLKMPANLDKKEERNLQRDKQKIQRVIERGVSGALSRLLDPAQFSYQALTLSADGTRAIIPTQIIEHKPFFKAKIVSTYRDLLLAVSGENPLLKKFDAKQASFGATIGDGLPNDYFFSGTFAFTPNYEKPAESAIKQTYLLFAKRGKTMGMRLQIEVVHDLSGKNFEGKVEIDAPITKAEG